MLVQKNWARFQMRIDIPNVRMSAEMAKKNGTPKPETLPDALRRVMREHNMKPGEFARAFGVHEKYALYGDCTKVEPGRRRHARIPGLVDWHVSCSERLP